VIGRELEPLTTVHGSAAARSVRHPASSRYLALPSPLLLRMQNTAQQKVK
jgi:hypothetical protein